MDVNSNSTSNKKKVIIIGGGPSGLSAAHELLIKGYDVELYEADNKFGGKVTSFENPVTNYPAEHGFHIFASYYRNLYETMKKKIPSNGKTLFDNLQEASKIIFSIGKKIELL